MKQSGSDVRKRQEVGRGLRLCVNQDGERMDANILGNDVHNINILTVIASESYTEIVALTLEMTQEELKKQYDKERVSLLLAADESNKITKTVPVDVKFKHTKEEILELLAMKLEQPKLSEREKYLLSLIESGKTAQLGDM